MVIRMIRMIMPTVVVMVLIMIMLIVVVMVLLIMMMIIVVVMVLIMIMLIVVVLIDVVDCGGEKNTSSESHKMFVNEKSFKIFVRKCL